MATAACSSEGGFVAMRWVHKPGAVSMAMKEPLAFGGEANQFIAYPAIMGSRTTRIASLAAKVCTGIEHVDDHGNQHDHEHEAGSAARVEGNVFLCVFDG